jgi:hypothetical protein
VRGRHRLDAHLKLRPDLDAIEALSTEREALWTRVDKATFLTKNEKRAAVGYGPLEDGGDELSRKYRPDQPRVPAGNPDGGQWTSDDGAGAKPDPDDPNVILAADGAGDGGFSPDRPGWHAFVAGPNLACRAELTCSAEEFADQLARFSVPGRDASIPVEDGKTYFVVDPKTGFPAGWVTTTISEDGLRVVNRTLPFHLFYDGVVERRAIQAEDGSWHVITRGVGNNVIPGMNVVNQAVGPEVFNDLDRRLRENIERHHGRSKSLDLGQNCTCDLNRGAARYDHFGDRS